MATEVPYNFPSQDDTDAWQTMVCEAVATDKLKWVHIADQQWSLEGECPRCAPHRMSPYFDFEVVVAEKLTEASFGVGAVQAIEVVCTCDPKEPHQKDTKGCGWGKSLRIQIPLPERNNPMPD